MNTEKFRVTRKAMHFTDSKGNGVNVFWRDLLPPWRKRGGIRFFFFYQLCKGLRCLLD